MATYRPEVFRGVITPRNGAFDTASESGRSGPAGRHGGRRPDADADRVGLARQAAAGAQVELPPVHLAGQHAAVDDREPAQVGVEVRATALHDPVAERDLDR